MNRSRVRSLLAATAALALLSACGTEDPAKLMESAKSYLAKHDNGAAVIQLRNALQLKPDDAEARYLLGKAQLDLGQYPSAEKELRRALELNHPREQVVPPLALAMLRLGQAQKVVDEFGKTQLAGADAVADLQATLGQAQLALGKAEPAGQAFAAALAAKPDHMQAVLGSAQLKAASRDMPGALALVERALAQAPASTEAWQLKGDLLQVQGQPDAALQAYRKMLEIQSDSLAAHTRIIALYGQQGKLDDAGKQLEALRKLAPKHPQTLFLDAQLAYQRKQPEAAREPLQELLRVAPDFLPAVLLAGAVEFELKSYAQAQAHLQKVLQAAPRHVFARRMLAASYLRSGQAAQALEALGPLGAEADRDATLLSLAGEAHMQLGEAEEAARYFQRAAALEPESLAKRTAAAVSRLATNDTERALRELESIALQDAEGSRADLAVIAVLMQRREFDKALAAVALLEKKRPNDPQTHNLRAGVLLGKNDTEGARKSFERALQLDGSYFPAAANLARLDFAANRPEDAKKRFEGILAKNPRHVGAMLGLAGLAERTNARPNEVAALIEKAVAADPVSVQPRAALIGYYLRVKDTRRALTAAQDAAATMPNATETLDLLGQAQQAAGEVNQAVTTYNKLAAMRPESPLPLLRLAQLHANEKNADAALDNLNRALAIKPDLLEAQRAAVALHATAGRTAEAIAIARTVQRQRPKQDIGYVLEGDAHVVHKAWSEAEAAYRSGLKNAAGPELPIKLHTVYLAMNNTDQAERFAAGWLKEHGKDLVFRQYLAERATAAKNYSVAAQHYKEILNQRPDNALVLNNLAWVAGQMKDPQAIEYAVKADRLAPNNAAILDTLGVLLIEKGEQARGLEALQKAVKLAPEQNALRLNLARALVKTGDKAAARKELETLAALGDKFAAHAEVSKMLKDL